MSHNHSPQRRTVDGGDLPPHLTVTDGNGLPDHGLRPQEVLDDGFTLAARIGASRGDQDEVTEATSAVLAKWGDHAGYVLASGITQLGRDLIPMAAEMLKASAGVDWPAHCAAMLEPGYDPTKVDEPSPRGTDPMQSGNPMQRAEPMEGADPMDGSASKVRKGEPPVPTAEDLENVVSSNYLERVADTADHIHECAEFLAEHVSNGGEYDLEDPDGIQFARDLVYTIDADAQKLRLLMVKAPRSQSATDEPSYITMETRMMTPAETDEHMRQTLTPEEYAEWTKPPTPAEQAEMDQFDAEWASKPESEKTTLRHMRATRMPSRSMPAPVTPIRPQGEPEDFTPMEIPASVTDAVREALSSSAAVEAARLYYASYRQGFDAVTQGAEFGPDRADTEDPAGYDHGVRDARASVWIDTGEHPPEPAA